MFTRGYLNQNWFRTIFDKVLRNTYSSRSGRTLTPHPNSNSHLHPHFRASQEQTPSSTAEAEADIVVPHPSTSLRPERWGGLQPSNLCHKQVKKIRVRLQKEYRNQYSPGPIDEAQRAMKKSQPSHCDSNTHRSIGCAKGAIQCAYG